MPQGMSNSHTYLGKLAHSHAQFSSSLGLKPSLLSPGSTSPMYAMPKPFMTSVDPIYSNFQPSGLFAPQYSLGGYAVSSPVFPPYVAGYSSQDVLSMPFEAAFGPNFNGQATSVLSEGIPHAGNFQYQSKCYGRHGLALQPPYIDLLNMQYYPHSFDDAYPAGLQQNQLASRILTGDQINSLVSQQNSAFNAYLDGGKFQSSVNGGLTLPSSRNMGITGSSYFGNPSTMGVNVMMQYPVLSLGSSIPPSSYVGGTNFPRGQDKITTHQVVGRSAGFCCGWRGSSYDDPKKESFVKDLQSIYSGKSELSYITGRIVEFSIDQHGSRSIQQKLETCNAEEKVSIFEEILPHAMKLITDMFGNYVIQKFFEHGSPDQRKKLANELSGQMLPLSLQMYAACYPEYQSLYDQLAIEVIEPDQKTQLVQELDGHVTRCVRDQNGNHVIQKCVECIPVDRNQFIISAFQGQVTTLSIHPYGCRVIQRILEHCLDEQHIQCIVDEILESAWFLTQDQYGNYVTQHVLERGKPHERSQIISKLTGKIVQLSQHKYASNVIEKCLEHGNAIEQEVLIEEIIGRLGEGDNLLTMMKDQFANYVVQKVLETSNDRQREILVNHVRVHLDDLKKYTYGKHIVARFELLAGPGSGVEVP